MSQKTSFDTIDHLIQSAINDLNPEKNIKIYPLWKKWPAIIGEKYALKTNPLMIRHTTLMVEVENSVWMNEVQFEKDKILKNIQTQNFSFEIKNIKFLIKK